MQRAFEEEGIKVITGNDFQRVRARQQSTEAPTRYSQTWASRRLSTATSARSREMRCSSQLASSPTARISALRHRSGGRRTTTGLLVDEHFQTANPDVYAAGDVIGEPELETVAAKEGNHAIKNAFGNEGVTIDYDTVPAVVFTSPEVASVGTTELEYMDEHGTCSCRTVQMEDVPRAKAVKNTDGPFRSSNTTKLTRSSASIWSVPAPPT